MNANKQDAGGLPEFVAVGEFVGYGRVTGEPHVRMSSGLRPGVRLFTEDQMRAYGELCRAAPAGGDVPRMLTSNEIDDLRRKAKQGSEYLANKMSAPAGSGEVEDENIANIESYAGVLERMARCNPRTADDFNLSQSARHIRDYAALLRKLQQGADYVMVPREPTQAMRAAGERERLSHPGNINPLTTWDAMIAASQGQEGV